MATDQSPEPMATPERKRCKARNRQGEPCKAWPVRGASVCVAHGGAAPQVRAAAQRRLTAAQAYAEMDKAMARYQRDLNLWQARTAAVVAELLDMPPERVTPLHVIICRRMHGRPADRKPEITDERYQPPRRTVRRNAVPE